MSENEKNLDLLAVFHYVLAGIVAIFSCFSIFHIGFGLLMILGKMDGKNPPPQFIGWMFFLMGSAFMLIGLTFAVLIFIAGKKLKQRRSWKYCLVIGALECMISPVGTVLGVFTIIVLTKEQVKQLFAAGCQLGQGSDNRDA